MDIASLRESLQLQLPTLHASQQDNKAFIRGRLPVEAHDGTELDHYQIEVEVDLANLKAPPMVREVGGRVPHTADRHNPDGSACLFVPDQAWEYWDESTSLVDFIKNGPVRDFFFSQTYFEETGKWPFGDRAHGLPGRVDYYMELAETKRIPQVMAFLKLLSRSGIKSRELCYCGKIKWLAHCHIEKILFLRTKITKQRAFSILKRLSSIPWFAEYINYDFLKIRLAESLRLSNETSRRVDQIYRPKRRRF